MQQSLSKISPPISLETLATVLKDISTYKSLLSPKMLGDFQYLQRLVNALQLLDNNWSKLNPSFAATEALISHIVDEFALTLKKIKSYTPEAFEAQELIDNLFQLLEKFYNRNVFKKSSNLKMDALLEAAATLKPPLPEEKEKKQSAPTLASKFNIDSILDLIRNLNRVKVIDSAQLAPILAAISILVIEKRANTNNLKYNFVLEYYTAPTTQTNLEQLNQLLHGLIALTQGINFENYPSNRIINQIIGKLAQLPQPQLTKNQPLVFNILDSASWLIRGLRLTQEQLLDPAIWCHLLELFIPKKTSKVETTLSSTELTLLLDHIDVAHRFSNASSQLKSEKLLQVLMVTEEQIKRESSSGVNQNQLAINIAEMLFAAGKIARSNRKHYKDLGSQLPKAATNLLTLLGALPAADYLPDKKKQSSTISFPQLKNIILALHGATLLGHFSLNKPREDFATTSAIDKVLARNVIANLELILAQPNAHKWINMFLWYTFAHGIDLSAETIITCRQDYSEKQAKALEERITSLLEQHKPIPKPFQINLAGLFEQKRKHKILVEHRLDNSPFYADLYDALASPEYMVELDGNIHDYSREQQENHYREQLIRRVNAQADIDMPIIHIRTSGNISLEEALQRITPVRLTKKDIETIKQLPLVEYLAQDTAKPSESKSQTTVSPREKHLPQPLPKDETSILTLKEPSEIKPPTEPKESVETHADKTSHETTLGSRSKVVTKLPNPKTTNRKTRQRQRQKAQKFAARAEQDITLPKEAKSNPISIPTSDKLPELKKQTTLTDILTEFFKQDAGDVISIRKALVGNTFMLPTTDIGILSWLAEQGEPHAQLRLGYQLILKDIVALRDNPTLLSNIEQGVHWLELAIEQLASDPTNLESIYAKGLLGYCYLEGNLKDAEEGVRLLKLAGMENPEFHYYLGGYYAEGWGVQQDMGKAYGLYQDAAMRGHKLAQEALVVCHLRGLGTEKSLPEALRLMKLFKIKNFSDAALNQAIELCQEVTHVQKPSLALYLAACHQLGVGAKQSDSLALEYFQTAADEGFPIAKAKLGKFYEYGLGVKQDLAQAVKLYKEAASRNCSQGKSYLGRCYLHGIAVEKDIVKAVGLFREALELDATNYEVHEQLGVCYQNGWGVELDHKKAIDHFRLALTEPNNSQALVALAEYYEKGEHLDQDLTEAFKLYKKAADMHDPKATIKLTEFYRLGLGCQKNTVQAEELQLNTVLFDFILPLNYNENHIKDVQSKPFFQNLIAILKPKLPFFASSPNPLVRRAVSILNSIQPASSPTSSISDSKQLSQSDEGYQLAQATLADTFIRGASDVEKGIEKMLSAFEKYGALSEGLYQLGNFFQTGECVIKDLNQAKKYFQQAAELGHKDAKARLKSIQGPIAARQHSGSPIARPSTSKTISETPGGSDLSRENIKGVYLFK